MYEYILNDNHIYLEDELILTNNQIQQALHFCNNALKSLNEQTKEFEINIFEMLGMRNLSGLVGEYFAKSIQKFSNESLYSNLHQDGYPDLLLINSDERKQHFESLYIIREDNKYPIDKASFSPFKYGGLEIKATCGNTPPAKKVPKPLIGESRIDLLESFEWKAHHRDTNNLIGVLWDFIDENPVIVAVFYRNDLCENDWGNIVQPKSGGGRTTSVSIMKTAGVKKMCKGWVAVIDNDKYIETLAKNKWIGYDIKNQD